MNPEKLDVAPEVRFEAMIDVLLTQSAADADFRERRAFSATALTVRGKIFALLARDRLVVKLPLDRVDALVAADAGQGFDPGSSRQMKEWFSLDPDAGED